MGDEAGPEAALFLNANDEAMPLGRVRDGRAARQGMSGVFAVIHRGPDTFTHVYVVPLQAVRARREVRLAAVFPGEALGAALEWASRCLPSFSPTKTEIRMAA